MGSFRARLTMSMVLVLGTCALFIQLYFPTYFHAQAEDALAGRADSMARLLGSTLSPALDFDDHEAARRRLGELAAVGGADAAMLFDHDQNVFADWSRTNVPVRLSLALPEGFVDNRAFYVDRLSIVGRSGDGGELLLLFNTEELNRQHAESARVVRFASGAMLALALIAALVLASLLMRPVSRVTAVARRISEGDVSAREGLDTKRSDEVGVMARALYDMVDRLVQQRALLESQSESSSEGILVAGRDGRLLTHNRRFRELWGITPQALAAYSLSDVLLTMRTSVAQVVPLLQRADDFTAGTLEPFKLTDGRVLTGYRAPILGEDGKPFALAYYFRDITELKSAQEQLVLADRRSSVGRLAAGVAHEVNNPLTFIMGNVQFCLDELKLLEADPEAVNPMLEALGEIQSGAARVAYIVRSLTALSRGDEGEREQVDLVECMRKTLTVASHELKHRARIETKLTLDHATVDANSVRIGQVFLNLLINAAKALDDTRHNVIEISVRPGPNRTVEVAVRDTGCGMSEAVKHKLFTPFFTTRDVGAGTGLGLSVSLSIVQSYGGTITVESVEGKGSTFTVRLPLSEDQGAGVPGAASDELPKRKLRLLVVDDEPQVAVAVRRSLGTQHDVTSFSKAEEALACVKKGERFDVMLTDLHMPGMNGAALYLEVIRVDPTLATNTLFMSGGAVTEEIRLFAESHEENLFPKPLDSRKLKRTLAHFTRAGNFHA